MNNGVSIGRASLKRVKWFLLLGMLVMGAATANDLDTNIKLASGGTEAVTAPISELHTLKDRLKKLFNGANIADWQQLSLQQANHQGYDTVQELPAAKLGRGFFAIKTRSTKNWLLQAPHADSDLYTGKIASRLFLEGEFKAAQWNTVKRSVSDMAHTPDTYWQAFTQVFAEQYPDGNIIQIHGYDQAIRKTEVGETSDMILSAGHDAAPLWLQQVASCLKKTFPQRVSLYPLDVKELGGTTNVQGQLLRSLGHHGFLHIEMSKTMRLELLENAEVRKRFLDCL
ncbi:MAG: hypothetical protein ABL884_02740 [Methyloglobulus sp.]